MLKKYWIYILFILITFCIFFFLIENKSTIRGDNNFAVSDKELVNKIFIADRSGTTITLNRVENNWIVNNKYKVRKDAITTQI